MNKFAINPEKYKNDGKSGLANLGNTCFLNSCVQVLNYTYELFELFENTSIQKYTKHDMKDYSIVKEWKDLREVMCSNNGVVSPNRFVFYVHHLAREKECELFTGWAQNDMPEFLLFLIECMHNSISRSVKMVVRGDPVNNTDNLAIQCYNVLRQTYEKEYSEIMDLFYGIYVSQIKSVDTGECYTVRPELFFIMDLPIPPPSAASTVTIYDCFQLFTQPEIMEGENAWFNEKTNQRENIQKQIMFWNLPNILVITLKRFSSMGNRKIDYVVDFPLDDLDLSKYVQGYNPNKYVYECYGICNHMGSVMGGHYTAFVKNAANEWIHCNDNHIDIVKNPRDMITPMAYCLFYRKKNNGI
jgi:ubiquitin C-terminal hydrolase